MENFTNEKDAIVILGLMSIANKNFDEQIEKLDSQGKKQPTHSRGLNIFATIVDNADGEVLSQTQNNIHQFSNPMLHAEQLCLSEAIRKINTKRPRNEAITVEDYYRSNLFNNPNSVGNSKVGSTIYTTLEPCPFCTTALLVTRMKRIVYIIPDKTFGGSFNYIKSNYYKDYDITCENINIVNNEASTIISCAYKKQLVLFEKIRMLLDKSDPANFKTENATFLLDYLKPFLQECYDIFQKFTERDLITHKNERSNNLKTLENLKDIAK